MARRTSSASHVGWCLALLLSGAVAPARAQTPQDDFAGAWGSNIGVSYTITQSGTQVSWTDSVGVKGTIVSTATGLSTTWSDAGGPHSATGTVIERDRSGRPTKIACFSNDARTKISSVDSIDKGWMALDIGPETIRRFKQEIAGAKTVIWNGPIGVFELNKFSEGTRQVAGALAEASSRGAKTIVGGGDSGAH